MSAAHHTGDVLSHVHQADFCHLIIPFGPLIKVHTEAVILLSGSSHQIDPPEIRAQFY